MRKLISYDELGGIACYMETDPDDPDTIYIRHYQRNATPLIEANKRTQIRQREYKSKSGIELHASIPLHLYMDWHKQGITEDPKYMNKLLNDEYSAFKATERKL